MSDTAYRPMNRKVFMSHVAALVAPDGLPYIEQAYVLAKYGHRGQVRACGRRYFDHVREVDLIVLLELKISEWPDHVKALLHDIREDSFVLTSWGIQRLFGTEVALGINRLSKIPKEGAYARLVEHGTTSDWLIKLSDNLQNMRSLGSLAPQKQRRQAAESRDLYMPLALKLHDRLPPPERWRAQHLYDQLQLATSPYLV